MRFQVTVVVFVLSLALVPARAASDVRVVQATSEADLDRDGTEERIVLTCYTTPNSQSLDRFVLEVNAAIVAVSSENVAGAVDVVDIADGDAFLEVVVPVSGPSGDESAYFFRYAGGQLWQIGFVPALDLKIDGSGTIQAKCRGAILHSWWFPCRYVVNPVDGQLQFVSASLYEMNTPVVLKRDLIVYVSQTSSEVAGVIKSGEKATILQSDNEQWCLIESDAGTKGWFRVAGYSQVGEVDAKEVFEGLQYFD